MKIYKEGSNTELKTDFDYKSIAKTISAFANTGGGMIFIGVQDNGDVKGVDIGKNTIETLTTEITNRLDPKIFPIIIEKDIDGKKIIEIKVEESFTKPHFANHVAYKRVGKSSVKLSVQELDQMFLQQKRYTFDSLVANNTTLEDISYEKVSSYLSNIGKNYNVESYLKSRNCVVQVGNEITPTNAGILLFGKEPQHYFINSYVTLVDYTVSSNPSAKRIVSIEGDLFTQLNELIDEIYRVYKPIDYLPTENIKREKLYQIPPEIIREVLVNSLIHRRYDDYGRKIIVKLYKDKIVCHNPAGLKENVDVTKLSDYQFSINPVISRVFFEGGYIEEIGEGVDKILKWTDSTGLQEEPVYQYRNEELVVTLYVDKIDLLISKRHSLTSRQKTILNILSSYEEVSSNFLAERVGTSKDTVLNELSRLQEVAEIEEVGKGRNTRYVWRK